jgi:DnaD/phage-associated family protein
MSNNTAVEEREISLIRTPHTKERPYFSMSRNTAQDEDLSWEARGVLAYLLSKPDDWRVQVKNLQQKCGRDKVRAILKELEAANYLKVERGQHNEKTGKFASNHYTVHETPFTEKPSTVRPLTVNPPITYKRGNKKEKTLPAQVLEEEKELPKRPDIYTIYEQNMGMLTPMLSEALESAVEDFTYEWVKEAIEASVKANVRRWKYAEAILNRWKVSGRDSSAPKPAAPATPAPKPYVPETRTDGGVDDPEEARRMIAAAKAKLNGGAA